MEKLTELSYPHEADFIEELLHSEGIECEIRNNYKDHADPLLLDMNAGIDVFVPSAQLAEAQTLLKQHQETMFLKEEDFDKELKVIPFDHQVKEDCLPCPECGAPVPKAKVGLIRSLLQVGSILLGRKAAHYTCLQCKHRWSGHD